MADQLFSDFDAAEIEAAQAAAKEGKTPPADAIIADPPATGTETKDTPPAEKPPVIANYAEYLAEKSGGLFKTEEDFIASLEKFKNYDSLEVKAKELETKIPTFKNEETRQWFELITSEEGGAKALKEYLAEKEKDYSTMADIDVRREALQKEHPQWSKKDVELELRHKYGKNLEMQDLTAIDKEEDPDAYLDAVNHNKEVEKNLELLAVHARDDRYSLLEKQKLIELPKIAKAETTTTQPAALTEEEIAANIAKWGKAVDEAVPNVPNIKLTIDNKEVEYEIRDEDKAQLGQKLKTSTMADFLKSRGWLNADGTPGDPAKIAADQHKLDNFDKIVTAMAGQVKTPVIRETLEKLKNIDNKGTPQPKDAVFDSFEEAFFDAGKKYKG